MPYHQPLPLNRSTQELGPPTGTGACRSEVVPWLRPCHSPTRSGYTQIADWNETISRRNVFAAQLRTLPSYGITSCSWLLWQQALNKDLPASEAVIRALPHVDFLEHDTDESSPLPLWENIIILFTQLPILVKVL